MPEILLKDRLGNPKGYSNVETIVVKDTEDNNVEYNNISTMELQVTSNGDYIAPEGKAYSKVGVSVAAVSKLPQVVDRSVTTITAEDLVGVTSIGEFAFRACKSLTSVTIPDFVTGIGDGAFSYCYALTSITIPNSVTSIGNSTFAYCSNLISVTIPDSVTVIGSTDFSYCTSLKSVTIPDLVTDIGSFAFRGCVSLTSITSLNPIPPTIQSSTFDNVPIDCNIYVPSQSVDAYKSAQYWSSRSEYIQAISE